MSKVKIDKALRDKGLAADIDFVRSTPTPSGYASGWDISLTEHSENKVFNTGFEGCVEPDCRNTKEALEWVDTLPNCNT